MREDFWSFNPTHKLVVATNFKPAISGDDDGIWRRLRLMPFEVQFWDPDDPNNQGRKLDPALRQDKHMLAKLKLRRNTGKGKTVSADSSQSVA